MPVAVSATLLCIGGGCLCVSCCPLAAAYLDGNPARLCMLLLMTSAIIGLSILRTPVRICLS